MFRRNFVFVFSIVIISCGLLSPSNDSDKQDIQIEPTKVPSLGSETVEVETNQDLFLTQDDLNLVPPDDIIQEVVFFGGLGGGCGGQICVCEMNPHTSPVLFASEESVEYLSLIQFQVCGVQENEIATVTIEIPGQSVVTFTIKSTFFISDFDGYVMDFEFTPAPPGVPGVYHFIFSGNEWEFDQSINVFDADGPRLYRDNQDFLTFYKFQPNERVRLFAYENLNLIGWKELIIEPSGTLMIKAPIDSDFIAVGEISGQVFDQDEGEYMNKWELLGSPIDIYCQGSQPSGITPIGNAELLVNNPPTYSYAYGTDVLTKTGTSDIEKGTILKISSNPICQEGSFYWLACIGSECNYMPESVSQQTYLRPTTRQADEISPVQTGNIPACPGTLPSRLSVGVNAEVTTSGMAPQLSLRAQPSMSAEKVHVIAAGRKIAILQGPVCADGSYWWYIRSEQGFEGWAREGDNEDYWIDPLP